MNSIVKIMNVLGLEINKKFNFYPLIIPNHLTREKDNLNDWYPSWTLFVCTEFNATQFAKCLGIISCNGVKRLDFIFYSG